MLSFDKWEILLYLSCFTESIDFQCGVVGTEQCSIAGMVTQLTKKPNLKKYWGERDTTNDILISLSATLPPVIGVGSYG